MTLYQRYRRLTFWNKLGVIASIVGILAFILTVVQLLIPEQSKPYPHFKFSLLKQDKTFEGATELTNDFLMITSGPVSMGNLFFPITDPSNIVLKLAIQNIGPILSEHTWVSISVSGFSCAPNSGWEDSGNNSWTFRPPDLLPGDSWELPDLHFSHVPLPMMDGDWNPSYCSILARAKDSPAEIIAFNFVFILVPTNGEPLMPIVEPTKTVDGKTISVIPSEIRNKFQK